MERKFDGSEKRKFERHVFLSTDEVVGFFRSSENVEDVFTYKIADISAGGLRFFLPRNDDRTIQIDDRFVLKQIMGKLKLAFITDIDFKVQWVVDHDMFGHMVIGGQFINISEIDRARIDRFVRYEAIGQKLDEQA